MDKKKENNKRITITLTEELDQKLDLLCEYKGIPKAVEAVNLIKSSIDLQLKVYESLQKPGMLSILAKLATVKDDKETLKNIEVLRDIYAGKNVDGYADITEADEVMSKLKKKKK